MKVRQDFIKLGKAGGGITNMSTGIKFCCNYKLHIFLSMLGFHSSLWYFLALVHSLNLNLDAAYMTQHNKDYKSCLEVALFL